MGEALGIWKWSMCGGMGERQCSRKFMYISRSIIIALINNNNIMRIHVIQLRMCTLNGFVLFKAILRSLNIHCHSILVHWGWANRIRSQSDFQML